MRRKNKFEERLNMGLGCFAVIAIVGAIIGYPTAKITGIPIQYSEGSRTGVVTKLSKKGIFFKTWEGDMNVGGMSIDGSRIAIVNVWSFSVASDEVAAQINEASKAGGRVTLEYTQPVMVGISQGDTNYIVNSISK